MKMRWAIGAALAASLPVGTAGATQPGAAQQAARDAQLARVADFFVAAPIATEMVIGGFDIVYRERLQREDRFVALERAYPGMHDVMVAAALRAARAELPGELARVNAEAIAYWSARLSERQLAAFVGMIDEPEIGGFLQGEFRIRTGETVSSALQRYYREIGSPQQISDLFTRRIADDAVLRPLAPLINQQVLAMAARRDAVVGTAVRRGLEASWHAANAHAQRAGGEPPFPGY
jgi:hypothetical protein